MTTLQAARSSSLQERKVKTEIDIDCLCMPTQNVLPKEGCKEQPQPVNLEQLQFSAFMESLKSRRFKILKRPFGPIASVDLAESQLFLRSDVVKRVYGLEQLRARILFDCIARWALCSKIVVEAVPRTSSRLSRTWISVCALRPILAFWIRNGSLPDSVLRPTDAFLDAFTSTDISRRPLDTAFAMALTKTSEDFDAEFSELQKQRFIPPPGKMIVRFRQTQDGVQAPIFGSSRFTQVSAFNHSGRTFRDQHLRRCAEDLLLEGSDFRLPNSLAEFRRAYQAPLEIMRSTNGRFDCAPLYSEVAELHAVVGDDCFPVTASGKRESQFSVLMYGGPISENGERVGLTGRTGVLFKEGIPVVKEIDNVEYLVELKGIGSPDGGIRSIMLRGDGRWSPTGGLIESFGEDEVAALSNVAKRGPTVKAVGIFIYNAEEIIRRSFLIGIGQPWASLSSCPESLRNKIQTAVGTHFAVIARLTPSVERLSYVRIKRQPPRVSVVGTGGMKAKERIAFYGQSIGSLFAREKLTAHLAAHLENIVCDDFGCAWQDYADLIPLYLSRAHFDSNELVSRRNLTFRLLNQTFFYVARTAKLFRDLDGTSCAEFATAFYAAFTKELAHSWELPSDLTGALLQATEPIRVGGEGITNFLWRKLLAFDNFVWCLENYDLPHLVFGTPTDSLDELHTVPYECAQLFLSSEIAFLTDVLKCDSPTTDGLRTTAHQIAEDSLTSTNVALRKLQVGVPVSRRDCMSGYLARSASAKVPRKVKSWQG